MFYRRCRWRCCRRTLFTFSSSHTPLDQIKPNLAKGILEERKRLHNMSNKMVRIARLHRKATNDIILVTN